MKAMVQLKHALWLLLGTVTLVASGCGKPDAASQPEPAVPGTAAAPAGGRTFGVSFQTLNNPFFVELNQGLSEVITAHGDRLVTLDAQFNSLKQKNDVSDLILQNATAVFINPVNWEGITGSLAQAQRKNVPCVIVDAPVKDESLVLCQVASDNVQAGRLAAQALAQARRPAKVAILHLSVNKACIDRVAGFTEELKNYPDIEIIDTQECKGTTEGGRPVMLDLLGRYPALNAVFPINDPSALGAISALESMNRLKDVTVVTVDGSAEGVGAIKAGKLLSTSAQFPKEMGRVAAQKVYDHLEGKPVEKDVKIKVELITQANADAFLAAR